MHWIQALQGYEGIHDNSLELTYSCGYGRDVDFLFSVLLSSFGMIPLNHRIVTDLLHAEYTRTVLI